MMSILLTAPIEHEHIEATGQALLGVKSLMPTTKAHFLDIRDLDGRFSFSAKASPRVA